MVETTYPQSLESKLRELLEPGFSVPVVKNATVAAEHPELGEGCTVWAA